MHVADNKKTNKSNLGRQTNHHAQAIMDLRSMTTLCTQLMQGRSCRQMPGCAGGLQQRIGTYIGIASCTVALHVL